MYQMNLQFVKVDGGVITAVGFIMGGKNDIQQ